MLNSPDWIYLPRLGDNFHVNPQSTIAEIWLSTKVDMVRLVDDPLLVPA
jgi:hypothetical protein